MRSYFKLSFWFSSNAGTKYKMIQVYMLKILEHYWRRIEFLDCVLKVSLGLKHINIVFNVRLVSKLHSTAHYELGSFTKSLYIFLLAMVL